jgi:hypothetical protein
MRTTLVLLFSCAFAFSAIAQKKSAKMPAIIDSLSTKAPVAEGPVKDSLRLVFEKMPKKAAWGSAIVPGLGQVYNKRWWKVPLIYGGFVAFVKAYQNNNNQYHVFLNEVQYRLANNGNPGSPDYAAYSFEGLVKIKDNFRRNKELSIIGGVVVYAVNIIDAYVDAKFFRFDISENLSLQLKPTLQTNPGGLHAYAAQPGLKLSLSL